MKTLSRSRQPSAGPRVKTAASRTVQPEHPPAAGTNGDGPGGGFALEILDAMLAFRSGNFSRELPSGWTGVYGKIADAFNDIVNSNRRRAGETARICRVVGKEGKLKQRLRVTGLAGQWADEVDSLRSLLDQHFDCAVLDLRLPDISGFELLDRIQEDPGLREIPIVVFTGKDLSPDEERHLKSVARSVVLKDVQSPERLLDETALFLHRVISELPPAKQAMIERLHGSNEALRGQKVLVVDDDARNIFALSIVLENRHMEVLSATNGRQAIELIENTPGLSMVLMDIMMPEMDGYQTMREIRRNPAFKSLPILALTAKAMKGDREKCLEAGASDYIAKPVNTDQLLSLLRVWLHR